MGNDAVIPEHFQWVGVAVHYGSLATFGYGSLTPIHPRIDLPGEFAIAAILEQARDLRSDERLARESHSISAITDPHRTVSEPPGIV